MRRAPQTVPECAISLSRACLHRAEVGACNYREHEPKVSSLDQLGIDDSGGLRWAQHRTGGKERPVRGGLIGFVARLEGNEDGRASFLVRRCRLPSTSCASRAVTGSSRGSVSAGGEPNKVRAMDGMVPPVGLEPTTHGLGNRRSIP